MANIKPRINKNGDVTSYLITVTLGTDDKGKKIRKTTSYKPKAKTEAKSKKEVEEFAVMFERDIREGMICTDGDRLRFRDFVDYWDDQWLSVRVMSGDMTQHCREDYIRALEHYGVPAIGHMKLTEIRAIHIDKIVKSMLDSGKSPKTIRNTFNVIRASFDYAFKKTLIRENPCLRCNPLPKIKRGNELHCFTEDQVKRFLNDALTKEYEVKISGHKRKYTVYNGTGDEFEVKPYSEHRSIALQFRVFFTLAVYGGFRRGELCALTWEDINDAEQTIRIDKAVSYSASDGQVIKAPKTAAGSRTIKLPSVCFDLLQDLKLEQKKKALALGTAWRGKRGADYDKNYVFIQSDGERMNVQTPSAKFRKIITAYNKTVPDKDKLPMIRLHDLRHTNASHLVASGVDFETIARRLGHSKPSFTLDIYGHALPENDEKASEKLEQIFADAK